METWHFGTDNDYLVDLVLQGKKTATTSIYDGHPSQIGDESILIFENEKQACITKTKEIIITEFKNITPELASLEGEGTFEEWTLSHINYFKSINEYFNDNTKVEFEIFEVTENLVLKRLELAHTIASYNKDLFGNNPHIEEINAGFNNSIFNVDNKYVIKVCGKEELEAKFNIEANFYKENQNNSSIPKLYKYDNTKKDVPYVYEIIEYVKGSSIYYHWYKMNEVERENLINKLMKIIKDIHSKEYDSFDWCYEVKNTIEINYNKAISLFNEEEQNLIKHSLPLYDKVLKENYFTLIHNDLHFDNILFDEKQNIKIIDFNDSRIAPFDYDLRIFYMCQYEPWKWAGSETDPYQKPEDYVNIFKYIKTYYPKLNSIKYLEERMIIYDILNDIKHLPRFKSDELKNNIIRNTKLLIERIKKEE